MHCANILVVKPGFRHARISPCMSSTSVPIHLCCAEHRNSKTTTKAEEPTNKQNPSCGSCSTKWLLLCPNYLCVSVGESLTILFVWGCP